MDKALELWKRWFEWSGDDPWLVDDDSPWPCGKSCFFCAGCHPNHEPDCIYVEAKKLVEVSKP